MVLKKLNFNAALIKKTIRIILKIVVGLIIFFVLIVGLILTPPVQQFIKGKAENYLQKKLQTKVTVGRIYIGLPKSVVLENIYLEDRSKDTLLYGGKINVDIALLKLLKSNIEVSDIELDNITAKVKRTLPDTTFNFQFIIDAFSSKEPAKPKDTTASSTNISLNKIELNKIRVLYNDAVTGADVELWLNHFDTKIDKFDLDKNDFDIPKINLDGLSGRVYQNKPLVKSEPTKKDIHDAQKPSAVFIALKNIDITKVNVDFRNDVSAFYSNINLVKLGVAVKKIDLQKKIIQLRELVLQHTTADIRLGKKEEAKVVAKEAKQEVVAQKEAGWDVSVGSISLDENNIRFDNDNNPRQKYGIDYGHIKADTLTLHVDGFVYNDDKIAGTITKGSFNEQSGFVLQQLQTEFLYGAKESHLKGLYLKTPGTELRREATIYYSSIDALAKDLKNLQVELNLQNSRVQVKDILTFVPDLRKQPAFADPSRTWFLNGTVRGKLSNLIVPKLQVSGLNETSIDVSGTIKGLPDAKNVVANLTINKISTGKKDLDLFLPKNTLPKNITLPDKIALQGKFSGGVSAVNADLLMTSNLGAAKVKGYARNFSDKNKAVYDVVVETRSLDIGTILQDKEMLGKFTLTASAKGTGYDPKTANAVVKGNLKSGVIKKYEYKNFNFNAAIADQLLKADASIHDQNIDVTLEGEGNFAANDPAAKFHIMVDSVKTAALHFTKDSIIYRGEITGDFPRVNVDSLEGEMSIAKSLLVMNGRRVQMDSIILASGKTDSGQFVTLRSDLADVQLRGKYYLSEVATVLQQAIQPYFAIMHDTAVKKIRPYDFTLTGIVRNNKTLQAFEPNLTDLRDITLTSHFSEPEWRVHMEAPSIIYSTDTIQNFVLKAGNIDSAALITIGVQKVMIGNSVSMNGITINSKLEDNKINARIGIKDQVGKQKYFLGLDFQQPQKDDYIFSLRKDSLLLNYAKWNTTDSNRISYGKTGINVKDFELSNGSQKLSIKSETDEKNAPILANFSNFRIATLTGFVQADSLLADGTLNGNVKANDVTGKMNFVSDLTITDFTMRKDTVGNIAIKVDNTTDNTLDADVAITGRGNDVSLNGQYYLTPVNNNDFHFDLVMNKLQINTIEGATMGAISKSSGTLSGKFDVSGTASQPTIDGDLVFDKAAFNLTMLNNYFMIPQDTVTIDKEGIHLDTFTIEDSASNKFVMDGDAMTSNLRDYNFDMTIRSRNFRALNTTKKDNKLYYGQIYLTTNLNVKGTDRSPKVDGTLTIEDKTKLTVVLPQNEPGVEKRDGVVNFIDMDAPENDSLFMEKMDSINTSALRDFDVNVNIILKKDVELNLIIDEGNGDFISLKGEATLNGGIDKSGKITLTGAYELESGSYELTFNMIHRKFDIQKGSRLTWTGEPTSADVDITAVYVSRAAPIDLVQNQLQGLDASQTTVYRQKLPFRVVLNMKGELMKPSITFDIQLPENENYGVNKDVITTVNNKLFILRQDPSEINKQVFALLLLNRFVQENPFESSSSGLTAESFARQSVSKLITDQLNQFASDLINFVDINFDVQSQQDYATGTEQQKTDLNVNVSKRLLNDRLVVSVGSNFQLEGPQAATQNAASMLSNISAAYKLSKDGRYMVRVYQRSDYQGVLEGYVVETGVGFIIVLDYNTLKDIFRKKKQREDDLEKSTRKNKKASS